MSKLFLEFELDEQLYELRCEGKSVATQGRVFDLIAYLIRHRDRIVSKDELTCELWGTTGASDTAISQVVKLARKALQDGGKSQRVIKTVRGRGFRFIAEVRDSEGPAKLPDHSPGRSVARSESDPDPRAVRLGDELVGREPQLGRLLRALTNLQQQRGGLILIQGEPGIGKSTLAEALAAAAIERGIDVHWGRAWEDGGASPFWPWIQVLRGMVERDGDASGGRFLGQGYSELLELLPELRRCDAHPTQASHGQDAQFRLFDAMGRFLRSACQRSGSTPARPRVIILEDLHAVDEPSIHLLRFLAPELDETALLVVGTFRDLALQDHPALTHLADVLVDAQRIRLEGLGRHEIAALLARRFAETPAASAIDMLSQLSGGNPLLLLEFSRRLDPARPDSWPGAAALSALSLPERIVSAVRRHLSGLLAETYELLATAAVLGCEFSLPLLAAICRRSESELMSSLEPALGRGLLQPSANGPDRLLFSHTQVRSAIYAELTPNRRSELHRRVAEQLEAGQPGEHLPLHELAHHYSLAAAAGCRRQAIDYAQRAAQRARDMRAYDVAAGLYESALQLSETEGATPAKLHELLCAAGDAWYLAGHLEHATMHYDRAANLARSDQAWERFATVVCRAVHALRGRLLHERARQHQVREALSRLPAKDSLLRARLLAASAIRARTETTLAQREATSLAAVEMARRLGDELTLLQTLTARHFVLSGVVHPELRLEIANEMVELGRKLNVHEWLLDALLCQIQDHGELGDHQALYRSHEEYVAIAEHFGSPWHGYMLQLFQTPEAETSGELERALELSERALRQGLRVGDPLAHAFHVVRILFMTLARGLAHVPADTHDWIAEPPACVPEDYHPFWALACLMQGRTADASNMVSRLLGRDRRGLVLAPLRRPLLAIAGEVCARLGDRSRGEPIYQALLPSAGLHLQLQAGVYLGPVCYYLGLLAAALGRREDAIAHFEQALAECEHIPTWSARTQHALATALGPNARGRVRNLLGSAESMAAHLGMTDLRSAIRHELARVAKQDLVAS